MIETGHGGEKGGKGIWVRPDDDLALRGTVRQIVRRGLD
jgi:hypothetical protein